MHPHPPRREVRDENFLAQSFSRAAAFAFAILAGLPLVLSAQQKPLPPEAMSDPILRALQVELARSKSQLKMDNVGVAFLHRIPRVRRRTI